MCTGEMHRGGLHMANYFSLTLDTTSPTLSIAVPQYTSPNIYTDISIVANENLMDYQDIYIIDSDSVRHDLILGFSDTNELTGRFIFNEFPLGIATIYARLKDDVGNLSSLYSKTINIVQNQSLIIEVETFLNNVSLNLIEDNVDLTILNNPTKIEIKHIA